MTALCRRNAASRMLTDIDQRARCADCEWPVCQLAAAALLRRFMSAFRSRGWGTRICSERQLSAHSYRVTIRRTSDEKLPNSKETMSDLCAESRNHPSAASFLVVAREDRFGDKLPPFGF